MEKLECEFDTAIGIPNTSIEKKAQLVSTEVDSSNADTACRAALWIDTITKGINNVIKLYPELEGQLSVDWRCKSQENDYNIEEESDNNDTTDID